MNVQQANVEYWFRLLYNCIHGGCYGGGNASLSGFEAFLAHLWLWITALGYLVSIIAIFVIVYCLIRIFELRKQEEKEYGTLILAPEEASENKRWLHIESLIDSANPNDWRQAIIEADIMLDDMLGRQGYKGESVGEKLQQVERSDFDTLDDAWEAHKIRNQIAHEGSAFDLSDTLARRTIARYGAVFREFGAI